MNFFLLILLLIFSQAPPAIAQEPAPPPPPEHRIALSFDLDQGLVRGTSRITVSAGQALILNTGSLEINGSSLQRGDATTPLQVQPTEDRTIILPALDTKQILLLSWSLRQDRERDGDTLISHQGITLTGFWHPVASSEMLFSLDASLPEGFHGICEAEMLENHPNKTATRMRASFPYPLRSLHFAAGPYRIQSRTLPNRVQVSTWFFPEDAHLAEGYLERATAYIQRYSELIGPYPYHQFSVVANRLPTGYGMPGFTLMGQQVLRLPFIKDTSLGHEVLHSWFGNAIGVDPKSGNWCEGLTSYLADWAFAGERGEATPYRKQQLLRYHAFVPPGNTMTLASFQGSNGDHLQEGRKRAIGYERAAFLFHMLRQETGDRVFFSGLRELYQRKLHQQASWEDFQALYTRLAGRDLAPFFRQWLERPDLPGISLENLRFETTLEGNRILCTMRQKSEEPYQLRVPLLIEGVEGVQPVVVELRGREQELTISSPGLPKALRIDPGYDLLRDLDTAERRPVWSAFLGAEEKLVVAPAPEMQEIYEPLLEMLQNQGAQILPHETAIAPLASASVLFLGESPASRALFASQRHPDHGFTLDVRSHPFKDDQVAVLVSSNAREQIMPLLRGLTHYGQYSFLHARDGRVTEKKLAPSADGIVYPLLAMPQAIPVSQTLNFDALMERIEGDRVIYLGETHNDYGHHLLQLQVIQALHHKGIKLAIGLEMFPRSAQEALDRYLDGTYDEKEFLKKSRYFHVWGYDYPLYRDILRYARGKGIPLVGLNLDKGITAQVFRDGHADALPDAQRSQIPRDRDLDLPGYRQRLAAVHTMHGQETDNGGGLAGFIQSQALWDEAMAENAAAYLLAHPDTTLVVLAGIGHVYTDSAIPPRLARRIPGIRQSSLAADNGMDRGLEQGRRLDYRLASEALEMDPPAKLGVVLEEEDKEENGAVRVRRISPHGKAGQSGLREGDILEELEGSPVESIEDLKINLLDRRPGDTVSLRIARPHEDGHEKLTVEVELSSMAGNTVPPGHPVVPPAP